MNKKGAEILKLAIADLIIIILFFSFCVFFISSKKSVEKKEIELLELAYIVSLFDDCEINSTSINISQIKYEKNFLIYDNYKEKIFPNKKIEIKDTIIVKNEK